jgi:hypothetical protein
MHKIVDEYDLKLGLFEKVNQKCLESLEMWCRKGSMKTSWNDRAKNKVLQSVKENENILHTIKQRKANWIGHIWLRKCLLKHVTDEK